MKKTKHYHKIKFDFLKKQGFELHPFHYKWHRKKDGFEISDVFVIDVSGRNWRFVKSEIKNFKPNGIYQTINKKMVRVND